MATEPERPMEKLLRAAATTRRDAAGGPFELPPADRRLLQGEVARQFAKPLREPRALSSLLAQLWPRFAWGVGILAVLGVAAWLVLPGTPGEKSQSLLAKSQPAPADMPAKSLMLPTPAPPAVIPPPSGAASPARSAAAAYANKVPAEPRTSAPQPSAEPRQFAKDSLREAAASLSADKVLPAAAPQGADRKEAAKKELAASDRSAALALAGAVNGADQRQLAFAAGAAPLATEPLAPPAPAPVAVPASTYKSPTEVASANRRQGAAAAMSGVAKSSGASLPPAKGRATSQRFAQVALPAKEKFSRADRATPAHRVLGSFQMEQSGSKLRLVDADGSVYSGYVTMADNPRRARAIQSEAAASSPATRAPTEERPADRLDSDQAVPQTYYFRVTGTNRSLRQKVVFTGNLLPASRAASTPLLITNLNLGAGYGGAQTSSVTQLALPLQNSRISGKLVIGNAKAVEVNAEPANP
jgi:hypothetical protein